MIYLLIMQPVMGKLSLLACIEIDDGSLAVMPEENAAKRTIRTMIEMY